MSQETCLDLLILCFRRKSEEDVSISLPIAGKDSFHFFPFLFKPDPDSYREK
ncbi:hypothetical protein [Algoriphagus sp. A40]|uniref:hypothetical protein n=1 Tax=Algoriphagus sp. A40 TaxID=1945863 RepID=UPI001C2B9A35|nr:hypothetical protein [Algoriphagus sp. A40]